MQTGALVDHRSGRRQVGLGGPDLAHLLQHRLPRAAVASRSVLVAEGCHVPFARGKLVLDDLEPAAIALVRAGFAATSRSDPDGRSQLIALHAPGDLAGLVGLGPHGRSVRVQALTTGLATTWPARQVLALARDDAGLAIDLLEQEALTAERLLTRLEHVGFDPVARRLARLLWSRRDVLFDTRRPLLTRQQLAELAGATREMTDRVLRGLEARGVISRRGRTGLVLLDEAALRGLADPDEDGRDCS